jgi:hypothetical protein
MAASFTSRNFRVFSSKINIGNGDRLKRLIFPPVDWLKFFSGVPEDRGLRFIVRFFK